MRKEAFGEIGLLPWDFYKMQYTDYILLQAGFANKRRYDQRIIRRAVTRLLEPFAAKGQRLNEYQIWPVPGDDVLKLEENETMSQVSERSLQILAEFKEKERLQNSKDN